MIYGACYHRHRGAGPPEHGADARLLWVPTLQRIDFTKSKALKIFFASGAVHFFFASPARHFFSRFAKQV